jgi:hypothetical protein
MGLDQYAYATYRKARVKKVLGVVVEKTKVQRKVDFFQWRKHPSLQGWMEDLYRRKGGLKPDFNCVPVEITMKDLDHLEADVNNRSLPETTGFFFGEDREEDFADDLEFVKQARIFIEKGYQVFYTSWW